MTTSPVMRWLADGVPITLLCDLATHRVPESQTINLSERPLHDRSDPLAAMTLAGSDHSPRLRAVSGG